MQKTKEEKAYWLNKAKKAEKEVKDIKESITFKTGKKIIAVPKKIKDILEK